MYEYFLSQFASAEGKKGGQFYTPRCVVGVLIEMLSHAWRGDKDCKTKYADIAGFCKSATLEDIRQHGHILTPGRYVGAAEVEDDGEPFEEKMARLTAALREQTEQSAKLDRLIWENLKDIGYGT